MKLKIFFLSILLAYNGGIASIFKGAISIHLVQIVLGFLALFLSFEFKLFVSNFKKTSSYLLPFLLFIIYCSYNISPTAPTYGKYKIELLVWCFFSIFLVTMSIKNLKELHYLIFLTLIQMIIGVLINGLSIDTSRTGAGEPIVAGRIGGMILCYAIYFKSKNNFINRAFLFFFGFLIVYLSGTRTVFLALIFSFLIIKFYDFNKSRFILNFKSLKYIITSILILFAFYFFIFHINIFGLNEVIIQRFLNTFSFLNTNILSYNSSFTRTEEWLIALEKWYDNLYFGIGTGGFGYVFHGFDERMYPHNIFLEILCELGIVGFLIFFYFIWKVIKLFKKLITYLPIQYSKFIFSLLVYAIITAQTSLELPNQFILFTAISIILTLINLKNIKPIS